MQPRVQPPDDHRPYLQYFLETSITGNFHLGQPGEIYGPFADDAIAPYAMEHATGLKPKKGDFLKSSQLCGTCHTVVLPTVDRPRDASDPDHPDELLRSEAVPLFRKFHHHVEQATYLEWLNSEYENEINETNPSARSCQDCHMARGLKDERHGLDIPQIQTRIAAIQDTTYPDAENLAPHDRLKVRIRDEGYRRHNFSGLNVFLLELFDQFDDVLGVRKVDFMTGSKGGIGHAVDDMARTARDDVASLDVEADWQEPEPGDGPGRRPEQGGPSLPERGRVPPRVPGTGGRRSRRSGERAGAGRLGLRSHERAGVARRRRREAAADGILRPRPDVRPAAVSGAPRVHHVAGSGPGVRDAPARREGGLHHQLRPRLRDREGQPLAAERLETRGPRPGPDRPVPPGDATPTRTPPPTLGTRTAAGPTR